MSTNLVTFGLGASAVDVLLLGFGIGAVAPPVSGGGTLTPRHYVQRVRNELPALSMRVHIIEQDDVCDALLALGANPQKRREEEIFLINLLT